MTTDGSPLSQPIRLGAITLKNRVVMAPMTRARSPQERTPTASVAKYYAQRAGAGMIVTEATSVSQQGTGSIATPGIYTPGQIAAWKKVTAAVHEAGGCIVCQLWHVGRVSHCCFQENGAAPVAPSAVRGDVNTFTENGFEPTSEPRALELEEIPGIVSDFQQGAHNAMEAGFDGVEIHATSGYLIEQFLYDGTNLRQDAYGGTVENRCRFMLEVTDAVVAAIGREYTGIRLSPFTVTWDCHESNPGPLYEHALPELDRRGLAFLEVVERGMEDSIAGGNIETQDFGPADVRALYDGALIVNGSYDKNSAEQAVVSGRADAVSFARPYIATPDLARRLFTGIEPEPEAEGQYWYGGGDLGYTEFPQGAS